MLGANAAIMLPAAAIKLPTIVTDRQENFVINAPVTGPGNGKNSGNVYTWTNMILKNDTCGVFWCILFLQDHRSASPV